jgi:demethylmenaquinone methyltransferase / 2-methoxy-6-polyprenyl-1,4-benzoquinol methylase
MEAIPFLLEQTIGVMAEKEKVRKLFDDISERYDFLNHFLSFGIDRWWRKNFVRVLSKSHPLRILDVATGTGDLAIAMAALSPEKIVGIDISGRMMEIGKKKAAKKQLDGIIEFRQGDAESIPFPDGFFDAVTVAFGVRNFENLSIGLTEMKRVLKPGGTMLILEFSRPENGTMKVLYRFYSKFIIPFIGSKISRNDQAYTYLPETIAAFPSGEDFTRLMEKAGMEKNSYISLTFGISTIYSGVKPV